MIYQDKGREELEAKLQQFKQLFEKKIGQPFDQNDFIRRLEERLEKRKTELFEGSFGSLTPNDLFLCVQILKTPSKDPEPQQNLLVFDESTQYPPSNKKKHKAKAGNE